MHKLTQLEENKVSVQFEDAGGETSSDSEAITSAEGAENGEGDPAEEIPVTSEETQPEDEETIPSVPSTTDEPQITDVVLNDTDKDVIANAGEDYVPAVVKGVEPETVAEAVVKDGATNVPTKVLQNAKAKNEDEKEKSDSEKSEDNTEDEEEKKKKFSLEQELAELQTKFAALQAENAELLAFKQKVEEKEIDELIASFYMLSDEDKKDVIENKAKYSLKEIKAELSIICVDKKVNFNLENASSVEEAPVTFNLNSHQADNLPAWLKAVEDTRNRNK